MPTVIAPPHLGQPLGLYSHGMLAPGGELLVVAGQVGQDGQGQLAGADVGAQTVQALENIRAVVEAAGCTMGDIVRFQTFLVSADDIPGYMAARQVVFPRYFPDGAYPPNTLLVVAGLVRPEFRIEIEALAVKPSRG